MDLQDKTIVVSGATNGIGRATAIMLASQGAEVLAIGRDAAKGADLQQALQGVSGGKGRFLQADLSLLAEARRVVSEISTSKPRLDAVILSAGGLDFEDVSTSEGLNRAFVTNFLQKVVLAEGLQPLLVQAQGRMVIVAADIPDKMGPDWENFEGKRHYAGIPKLPRLHSMVLSMVQRWAGAWAPQGVEVMAIHPGLIDTGFFRSAKGPMKILKPLFKLFTVPAEKPAALLTWLAFSTEAKGLSGWFCPSVKDYGVHRKLQRDEATLSRVEAVVRGCLKG